MKNSRYFAYLCSLVRDRNNYKTFERDLLLGQLHNMEFYSLIPNDDNRGEDGKELRRTFIDEVGPHALSHSQTGPCTVLEMLIGLALRLEFETAQSQWEKTPSQWFWILIDNLGLMDYTDEMIAKSDYACDEIVTKVSQMLERRYKSDGNGGLFPLKNPKKDQRKVEIWYQMSAYVLENYPILD